MLSRLRGDNRKVSKRTAPRIIAGELKGLHLKSPPGTITRPITDRVKENLFNIIGYDIIDASFLDLFAGTGSVGIEAYSRGAGFVHFIEKNQLPFSILQQNIALIKDQNAYSVTKYDAFHFISSSKKQKFDYIFVAPPQYKGMWTKTLHLLDTPPQLLNENGTVIVQIDPVEEEEVNLENFVSTDRRQYGSTLLLFYKKRPNP